jgi:hypothetical protein
VLGQIGLQAPKQLKTANAVDGIEVVNNKVGLDFECKTCLYVTAHTRPFPKESQISMTEISELIVTNIWGPACMKSISNYRYSVSFTDVTT